MYSKCYFISGLCEESWTHFHGTAHCYRYFDSSKTWEEAESHCQSLGADLLSIHSLNENDFIKSLVGQNKVCRNSD